MECDVIKINFEAILAELTGGRAADWMSIDGPDSGCGQDYWFANCRSKSEGYVNIDQDLATVSVDGETLIQADLSESWFSKFKT